MNSITPDLASVTVTVRASQLRSLRELAERRGVTIDDLIQDGIDRLQTEVDAENELMLGMIGVGDDQPDTPTDLAEQHDFYLVAMLRNEQQ